jgi:sulfur-oxidizing protein SoxX
LRGIVVNAKMMFDGTIMPAFYIDSGYERPLKKFDGKSILTAQQVEDVVAYLLTLKD